jgi:hypothetical protein
VTKLFDLGSPIKGQRLEGEPAREQDHFYKCGRCGQQVDRRDLRQVIWYEQEEHEPLEMDLMPKDRSLTPTQEPSRGSASEASFNRALKKTIKGTMPKDDEAPPMPTKKVVKSPRSPNR